MLFLIRTWVLLFSLCSSVVYADLLVSWQSKNYIKKAFFEIAYKNEYQLGQTKLRRWQQPIRYRVDYFKLDAPVDIVEMLIQDHFQDLSKITGVDINKDDKNPNFRILLTRKEHYKSAIHLYTNTKIKNLDAQTNCLLHLKHNKQSELISVLVIIPVDHAMSYGLLPACVIEELTQAMGLPNDSDWVIPSIANDKSVLDLLTGLDYLLLKILYDNRLHAGMGAKTSSPLVDKILIDFENQDMIESSVLRVQELNINKYFN